MIYINNMCQTSDIMCKDRYLQNLINMSDANRMTVLAREKKSKKYVSFFFHHAI